MLTKLTRKIAEAKYEIKKDLEESTINGERNKNIEMQEKVNNVITSEDTAKVLQEFEQNIKNKKTTLYS